MDAEPFGKKGIVFPEQGTQEGYNKVSVTAEDLGPVSAGMWFYIIESNGEILGREIVWCTFSKPKE